MTTVWLAGASGLVGGELLSLLLADASFDRVVAVGRRVLTKEKHPKLESVTVDFADKESFAHLEPPKIAFCTLGTTIKKAGSQSAFESIDHDAVVVFAKAALAKGARSFVHVTSIGSDPNASSFYLRVKGQTERDVAALGFETVVALRPSFLDGDREESRPLERVGLSVARALGPVLGRYRPTSVAAVARSMIANAEKKGSHVIDSREIE